MKQQTAVEWLVQEIFGNQAKIWQNEIDFAKEMERKQILDAYHEGRLHELGRNNYNDTNNKN